MRARSQADYEDTPMRITEPGDGPAPIDLVSVCPSFFKRDFFTPLHQARTTATIQELLIELLQGHRQILPHKTLEIPSFCVTLRKYWKNCIL
jgi:hypothetical protein